MRILICLTVTIGVAAAEDFKTPEAVARTVFKALKQDDFKLMSATLTAEEDITWLLEGGPQEALSQERAERIRKDFQEAGGPKGVAEAMLKGMSKRFRKARNESAKNFDWTEAEFDSCKGVQKVEDGVTVTRLAVWVKTKKGLYRFRIRLAKYARGWGCLQVEYRGPELSAEVKPVAKRVFEALKRNDFDHLTILLLAGKDLEWLVEVIEKHGKSDEKGAEEAAYEAAGIRKAIEEVGMEKLIAGGRELVQKKFARARELAARRFDWTKAEFGGVDEEESEFTQKKGHTGADIHFRIKVEGTYYGFRMKECRRFPRGWILLEGNLDFRGFVQRSGG